MANYWCTFRLAADKSYRARYEALTQAIFAIRARGGAGWSEPSYFAAFQSALTMDEAAAQLVRAIDPARDVLVLGIIGKSDTVFVGPMLHAEAFQALYPKARRLG